MTYHTLIRHQELVALLGTRNLQLRLVYAHIANYTQARGAWCGSKQKLADELEIERTVVSRKLEELTTRGLIYNRQNELCIFLKRKVHFFLILFHMKMSS